MGQDRTRKDIEADIKKCEAYIKSKCSEYMEYERRYLHERVGNADTKANLYRNWKSAEESEKENIKK